MKKLYHLFRYKLRVTSYKLRVERFKRFTSHLSPHTSHLKPLFAFLFLPFAAFAQATVTGVLYSCPEQVTVTYNLKSTCPVNLTLQYSHDCKTWTEAVEVEGNLANQTGTGTEEKTIVWNNADEGENGVIFGKFYFKVTYPGSEDSQEPVEHDYVEINGLKWATTNLAEPYTFVASPTDTGWYYQWSINVGWRPYPATPLLNSDGGSTWIGTINNDMPQGWVCDHPCPFGWRLPTFIEYATLAQYNITPTGTGAILDLLNGISGRFFDSGDPCQPLLFLPAAGYRSSSGSLSNVGRNGTYWNSRQNTTTYSNYLNFTSTYVDASYMGSKAQGFTIRCVSEN